MSVAGRQRFTFHDYVQLEEIAHVKHEFLGGEVWAMAGGSPEHAGIAANLIAILSRALGERPCRAFTSDLRVRVLGTGLGTYPDVTVICGAIERDPEDPAGHTVTNPRVVFEVLSPSTEDYDRGEKLGHYKHVASLDEVVLVAHDRQEIEIVRRETNGSWSRHVHTGDDEAPLASLGISLSVRDVYRNPLG